MGGTAGIVLAGALAAVLFADQDRPSHAGIQLRESPATGRTVSLVNPWDLTLTACVVHYHATVGATGELVEDSYRFYDTVMDSDFLPLPSGGVRRIADPRKQPLGVDGVPVALNEHFRCPAAIFQDAVTTGDLTKGRELEDRRKTAVAAYEALRQWASDYGSTVAVKAQLQDQLAGMRRTLERQASTTPGKAVVGDIMEAAVVRVDSLPDLDTPESRDACLRSIRTAAEGPLARYRALPNTRKR